MQLNDMHAACLLFAAADSDTDYYDGYVGRGRAYEDRQDTFRRMGRDEHAAYRTLAYDACMSALAANPALGQAAREEAGRQAILDSFQQVEAESHVQVGLG